MLVQSRLHMLPYIHQMNRVNSRNDRGHDASTVVAVIDGQAYKHRLVFTQKNRFWPSYCQISTDMDKILLTPIIVRNGPT